MIWRPGHLHAGLGRGKYPRKLVNPGEKCAVLHIKQAKILISFARRQLFGRREGISANKWRKRCQRQAGERLQGTHEIQPLHGVASLIERKRLERIVIPPRVTEITVCMQNRKIVCNA